MHNLDTSQLARIEKALLAGASVKDVSARFGFSVMFLRRRGLIPKNRIRWSMKRKKAHRKYHGEGWRGFALHG
jgi:hypothetical protein